MQILGSKCRLDSKRDLQLQQKIITSKELINHKDNNETSKTSSIQISARPISQMESQYSYKVYNPLSEKNTRNEKRKVASVEPKNKHKYFFDLQNNKELNRTHMKLPALPSDSNILHQNNFFNNYLPEQNKDAPNSYTKISTFILNNRGTESNSKLRLNTSRQKNKEKDLTVANIEILENSNEKKQGMALSTEKNDLTKFFEELNPQIEENKNIPGIANHNSTSSSLELLLDHHTPITLQIFKQEKPKKKHIKSETNKAFLKLSEMISKSRNKTIDHQDVSKDLQNEANSTTWDGNLTHNNFSPNKTISANLNPYSNFLNITQSKVESNLPLNRTFTIKHPIHSMAKTNLLFLQDNNTSKAEESSHDDSKYLTRASHKPIKQKPDQASMKLRIKKMMNIKQFNLFRPSTINNLHIIKDICDHANQTNNL